MRDCLIVSIIDGEFPFAEPLHVPFRSRMLSETAPDVETVLTRLREEAVISTEDGHHVKHLLSLLGDAGVTGMEPAQLLVRSSSLPQTPERDTELYSSRVDWCLSR